MYPSPSSRWCPTPEQLMILEEMYRGGLRTPKAPQIQQITAHLSLYGKIEGKNVFYWFQNHKARERQKLRRKLMAKQLHHEKQNPNQQIFHPQLFYYIPVEVLPQGGIVNVSAQMMSHSQPMDPLPDDQRCEVEKPMARTDDRDWVMMLNVGQTTPSHCNKPLKTLELFPTTPTGLKDECTTRNQTPSSTPTKQP